MGSYNHKKRYHPQIEIYIACGHQVSISQPCTRSRGSTGRSSTEPLGNESFECVKAGNWICARTLVICLVVVAMQCWVVLEQPKGSLMEMHPAFQAYLNLVENWRTHIQMKDFGGPSSKPTWLYSNRQEISEINEFRPQRLPSQQPVEMVVRYTDGHGQSRVKGGKHLKQSQSYPKAFLAFMLKFHFAPHFF